MVRFPFQTVISEGHVYAEGFCKSTDAKPTKIDGNDLITGSSLFEVDTSDAYLFEEDGNTWEKQGNSESTQEGQGNSESTQEGD